MILRLKIFHNNQIKKYKTVPNSLPSLQEAIQRDYSHRFTLKYQDLEGDMISLITQPDYDDAIELARQANLPSLKLYLYTIEPPPKPSPLTASFISLSEEFEVLGDAPFIWDDYQCNGCNLAPITGPRYSCTICADFDYCQKCEEAQNHPHNFVVHKDKRYEKVQRVQRGLCCENLCRDRKCPLKMKFLTHVNWKIREIFSPGAEVRKVWKVLNSGDAQ